MKKTKLKIFIAFLVVVLVGATAFTVTTSTAVLYKLGNVAYQTVTITSGDTVTYKSFTVDNTMTVFNIDSVRNHMHLSLNSASKAVPGNRIVLIVTCAGTTKSLYFHNNLVSRDTVAMVARKTYVKEFVYDGTKFIAIATAHRAD